MATHTDETTRGPQHAEHTLGDTAEDAVLCSDVASTTDLNLNERLNARCAAQSHLLYLSPSIAEVEAMAYERNARSSHQQISKKSIKRARSQYPSDISDTEATRSSPRSRLSDLHINSQSSSQNEQCPTTASSSTPHSLGEDTAKASSPTVVVLSSSPAKPTGCVYSMLTPSSTAVASDRASSPLTFDNFPERIAVMKRDYYEQGRIFTKTRQLMLMWTRNMFVNCSRGFVRSGFVPTKQTRPRLHTRRYSIDVNTTKNWERPYSSGWQWDETIQAPFRGTGIYETEPLILPAPHLPLPDPRRFSGFSRLYWQAPRDEGMYLDLGDATIKNKAFVDIAATNFEWGDPWMHADSIDMALEILRRQHQCEHYSIDIANSNSAQIFYLAWQFKDGSAREYEQYRARFCDKRWIFIIINDAIGGEPDDGRTVGNHWSLVALNRQARIVHYYDSFWIKCLDHHNVACDVAAGLLLILGEDTKYLDFKVEDNSPHQNRDNQFENDCGACGPFVYAMTDVLIRHILGHQHRQTEPQCVLGLEPSFPRDFRNTFNSLLVRRDIQANMVYLKSRHDAPLYINAHDEYAVRDEEVVLSDEFPLKFSVPARPRAVRYSHFARTPSPDWNSVAESEDDNATQDGSDAGTEPAENIVLDSSQSEEMATTEYTNGHDEENDGGISLVMPYADEDIAEDGHPRTINMTHVLDDERVS